MDDIIEIYEPLYRETFNIWPIVITAGTVFLLIILFIILRKVKRKKEAVRSEGLYKKTLNDFIILQSTVDSVTSHYFSNEVMTIFKEYLTQIYNKFYRAATIPEMLKKLNSDVNKDTKELQELFINEVEPAQYGKLELNLQSKNKIIKECVDLITIINNNKGVDND